MAVINFARREIIAKVLYYGAEGAGTTATLRRLYLDAPGRPNGGMLPFGPSSTGENTLVFELEPDRSDVPGFQIRLRLYSLPGGLQDPLHRAEVLRDVDAIVFIADARPERSESNLDALLDLDRNLRLGSLDLARMPVVFQVNHSDATAANAPDAVAFDLNPYGHPVVQSSVKTGDGLVEGLRLVTERVCEQLRENLAGRPASLHVHAIHRREAATIEQVVDAHQRAIAQARSQTAEGAAASPARGAPAWSRSHYDILPIGHTVELPYQPAELTGMRPVHILESRIDAEQVSIDLVLDDPEGASPTRLRVVLRPPDDATTPALPDGTEVRSRRDPEISFSGAITTQPTVEVHVTDPSRALAYALGGAGAGLAIGLLTGFLVWA